MDLESQWHRSPKWPWWRPGTELGPAIAREYFIEYKLGLGGAVALLLAGRTVHTRYRKGPLSQRAAIAKARYRKGPLSQKVRYRKGLLSQRPAITKARYRKRHYVM